MPEGTFLPLTSVVVEPTTALSAEHLRASTAVFHRCFAIGASTSGLLNLFYRGNSVGIAGVRCILVWPDYLAAFGTRPQIADAALPLAGNKSLASVGWTGVLELFGGFREDLERLGFRTSSYAV